MDDVHDLHLILCYRFCCFPRKLPFFLDRPGLQIYLKYRKAEGCLPTADGVVSADRSRPVEKFFRRSSQVR